MNEKHYDNLCIEAEHLGEEICLLKLKGWAKALLDGDHSLLHVMAGLYNSLDELCIASDCEEEVQDIAEEWAKRHARSIETSK